MPDFRAARTYGEQMAVAHRELPETAEEPEGGGFNRTAHDGVREAADTVAAQARAAYADVEKRLEQVAAELTATPLWQQAPTMDVRKIRAQDFLREHTGGYPPPTRVMTLLFALPQMRARAKTPASCPAQSELPVT